MMIRLAVGKLSSAYLDELLREHCRADDQVIVGPGVGEDAAVIDLGSSYLVASTDPITFATEAIGWYAVQINANDIATMGAVPRWFLATLLLPEKQTTKNLVRVLFDQLSRACQQVGVSWIGGHTEITSGLDRAIVVGTMLGEVAKDRLVTSAGAQVGDVVILTKGIAVEATALIAREKEQEVKVKYCNEFLERCKKFLYDPGIGVLRDAMVATARRLMDCGFWALYAHTHSDEISLLLHREDATFGRRVRKILSVLAGEASACFSLCLGEVAVFDARISQLPTADLVAQYFRWRQADAYRNALHGHCFWTLQLRRREAPMKLPCLPCAARKTPNQWQCFAGLALSPRIYPKNSRQVLAFGGSA